MYRVGYLDDEQEVVQDYVDRIKRYDIELMIAPNGTMEDIMHWIVDNQIKCMLIDYRLEVKYNFSGTEFVNYLNDELRGLPCFILTSYRDTSIQENKVIQNNILDRSRWDDNAEGFVDFCRMLIQATEVYDRNLERYKRDYEQLLRKKENKTILESEDSTLIQLYHLLKNFGEVDEIPESLFNPQVSNQLDAVLNRLDKLLKK